MENFNPFEKIAKLLHLIFPRGWQH